MGTSFPQVRWPQQTDTDVWKGTPLADLGTEDTKRVIWEDAEPQGNTLGHDEDYQDIRFRYGM